MGKEPSTERPRRSSSKPPTSATTDRYGRRVRDRDRKEERDYRQRDFARDDSRERRDRSYLHRERRREDSRGREWNYRRGTEESYLYHRRKLDGDRPESSESSTFPRTQGEYSQGSGTQRAQPDGKTHSRWGKNFQDGDVDNIVNEEFGKGELSNGGVYGPADRNGGVGARVQWNGGARDESWVEYRLKLRAETKPPRGVWNTSPSPPRRKVVKVMFERNSHSSANCKRSTSPITSSQGSGKLQDSRPTSHVSADLSTGDVDMKSSHKLLKVDDELDELDAAEAAQFKAEVQGHRHHGHHEMRDSDDEAGPMPVPQLDELQGEGDRGVNYGGALLPGEGAAIAQFVQKGLRIPRRGEVGWAGQEIEKLESSGYVMSGSRHARMNAVRLRKENQVFNAEERRALALIMFEEKQQKENEILGNFRQMLTESNREGEKKTTESASST